MNDLVRLRVLTAFNSYRVGDIIERIPSVARQMLVKSWYGRKLVEEVKPEVVAPVQPLVTVGELPVTENKSQPQQAEAGPTRKHKKRGKIHDSPTEYQANQPHQAGFHHQPDHD